jgi:RNA polymerase sigma factor (sigma-70 family)
MSQPDRFPTTQWTLVVQAGAGDEEVRIKALNSLFEIYRAPVLAFMRNHAPSQEDAEDWVQGFLASLAAKESLGKAQQSAGKFRAFLLAMARNYLTNAWREKLAVKRGGGVVFESLDERDAGMESVPPEQESAFDREWAAVLVARVMERLKEGYERVGKGQQFEILQEALSFRSNSPGMKMWCEKLGISSGAVKTCVHRLRKSFAELLREEVRRTVADKADVEGELRHLLAVLGNEQGTLF